MKKIMFALSTMLILVVALGTTPTVAFADETLAAHGFEPLGTVETNAVTGPIEVGGITYIPCSAVCRRSSISGTAETMAVTSPIEVDNNITYVPDVAEVEEEIVI